MSLKEQVLAALHTIATDGPDDNTLGICANVATHLTNHKIEFDEDELDELLERGITTWPDKSISDAYPVGNWSMQPSRLFWKHFDDGVSMWEPNTRYGTARIALLGHMYRELSQ